MEQKATLPPEDRQLHELDKGFLHRIWRDDDPHVRGVWRYEPQDREVQRLSIPQTGHGYCRISLQL